jgi:FkbM family methyltransferase
LRVLDLIKRRQLSFPAVECLLVEASPRLERIIRNHLQHVQQNGLQSRIVIGLVGKKKGEAQLEFSASECMNRVVKESHGKSKIIAYFDLDKALEKVTDIDLLKCDIEGSERDFLENYPHLLRKTKVAAFEFHEPECDAPFGSAEVMKAGFTKSRVICEQGLAQTVCFERS